MCVRGESLVTHSKPARSLLVFTTAEGLLAFTFTETLSHFPLYLCNLAVALFPRDFSRVSLCLSGVFHVLGVL